MNNKAIHELLASVKGIIQKGKESGTLSNPDVKTVFEHLRTSLEYLNYDIHNKLRKKAKRKTYFPFGYTKQDYIENRDKNLPGIESQFPALSSLIENIQPFQSGDDWLTVMCSLTNQVKHTKPIELNEKKSVNVLLSVGGMPMFFTSGQAKITMKGGTMNGRKIDDFTLNKQSLKIHKRADVNAELFSIENKTITIDGHNYELFGFLEKCSNNINAFTIEAYKLI
ncbi:TPA: hypothetical protein ACPTY8_000671 [Klebsiella pneumoniae]|nr:hypothetical protein [Klebsiella pneumoniae]